MKPVINIFKSLICILLTFNSIIMDAQSNNTAIELTKMNVFYCGVDNPIKIMCQNKFDSITINNGKITYISTDLPANFVECIVNSNEPGETILTIYANGKIISENQFRSKQVPMPQIFIAGKLTPEKLKKSELALVENLTLRIPSFDFNVNFNIVSFDITGKSKGKFESYSLSGNTFNAFAKDLLNNLDVDSKLFIDFKIKGPDGKISSSNIGIKVIE
jgi:hypothetical protein